MNLHLNNADIVLIIALALVIALLLAFRLRTASWIAIAVEALVANTVATAAVVAIEMLFA